MKRETPPVERPGAPPESVVYLGLRDPEGTHVMVIDTTSPLRLWRPLDPRFDLANHSPTGFEWGYGGSGPAQLALALASDALTRRGVAVLGAAWRDDALTRCATIDRIALATHQAVKEALVASLPRAQWILDAGLVLEVVAAEWRGRARGPD